MKKDNDSFNNLILKGAFKHAGVDPVTGENLYVRTEKLKNIDPKLDQELSSYFSETMMFLWQKGFVNMDVTKANPIITLTEKSFNQKDIDSLENNERIALQEAIRILLKKK